MPARDDRREAAGLATSSVDLCQDPARDRAIFRGGAEIFTDLLRIDQPRHRAEEGVRDWPVAPPLFPRDRPDLGKGEVVGQRPAPANGADSPAMARPWEGEGPAVLRAEDFDYLPDVFGHL